MSYINDSYTENNKRKIDKDDTSIDTKFKIPKKKKEDTDSSTASNSQFVYNAGNSIADNQYYEYNNKYEQGEWQNSTAYPSDYNKLYNLTPSGVGPITQNICETLSSIKEAPKNYQKDIFREIAPDTSDPTLPKELKKQFQPLYCKLCTAHLSSNVMAKLHYRSKNHEKKVRKFLLDYAESTNTPLHKRATVTSPTKAEKEADPKWYHCVECDLPLTGRMHAESHYMGKNHQKVVMGYKLPTGSGHYNNEGKWVRKSTTKVVLKDGEDGFGQDFREKKPETTIISTTTPTPKTSQPSSTTGKYKCSICDIGTTCQEQLNIHFQGQKHKKKLRQLGINDPNILEGDFTEHPADLHLYRTPSGDYYCPSCNITLSSGVQFKIHIKGKSHFKKQSQKS
ncbi:zinc finger protein 346 [Diabrotica virgifera virgifera]|uniref:Zinc finger protein 346-like n=1 Tax=Diabrotica virgifera virgifera TaxID=50390 RepID=A0A6P7GI99_DIAVI|nr:zinc finger protein 346 [Diabrotica virgifera virgifera]